MSGLKSNWIFYRQDSNRDVEDYGGTLQLSRYRVDGGPWRITIDHADPRIRINREIMVSLGDSDYVDVTDGPDGFPYLRIRADNRTVVYRIVGYDHFAAQHLAEWPD